MDSRRKDDFYGWVKAQAALARSRSANAFDWDAVAEELEALGKSEERELISRYRVLLAHLQKWMVQRDRRSRSWALTIANQRDELATHLADNPSLKAMEDEAFEIAWRRARRDAAIETELDPDLFPEQPPFTRAQALDEDWLPA